MLPPHPKVVYSLRSKSIQMYNISLCRSSFPLAALSSRDIPLIHDRNESAVLWYSRSSSIPPQSPPIFHRVSSSSAYSSSSDSMYLCLMSFH